MVTKKEINNFIKDKILVGFLPNNKIITVHKEPSAHIWNVLVVSLKSLKILGSNRFKKKVDALKYAKRRVKK